MQKVNPVVQQWYTVDAMVLLFILHKPNRATATIATEWKEHLRPGGAVVVCWVSGCFIHNSVFLHFASISQYRQDEIGWLVLFTSFSFVLGEFCCPERTPCVLCNQVAHSSKWHITYQAPTVFCFFPPHPIFFFVANVLSRPWSIAQRWRCVSLSDLTCRSSEPGSMAAIFSLASHEEARDVNGSLCLLNTQ